MSVATTSTEEETGMPNEEPENPYSGEEEARTEVQEELNEASGPIEDTETPSLTLDDLPRAGPAKIQSLRDAGYTTPQSIAYASPTEIAEKTSFGDAGAESAVAWAREVTGIGGFITGSKSEELRDGRVRRLTTGSESLDLLFVNEEDAEKGLRGLETGGIIEVYGEYASTKTQLAHQLCVTAQLPEERGGLGGKVLYVDTEDTWRPKRIRDMCERYDLDPEEVLSNIMVADAPNTNLQMGAVQQALKIALTENIVLLVVDSLTANFRDEWSGRGELADRQQTLRGHMADLRKVARLGEGRIVFVTNQVMKDPAAGMYIDPTKSVGGDTVGHQSKWRCYLKKPLGKKEGMGVRVARLVDSPDLPVREAVFQVTKDGVVDYDE